MQPVHTVSFARTRTGLQWLGRWVCLCLLLCTTVAFAKGGHFEVRSASTKLRDGVYYLDARIDYRLSDKALEALDSGVELTVELQIELSRQRSFMPDPEIATLQQRYLLSYQPLSQRYVVKNLNSGESASYATLFSALNNLGRVEDVPLIDAALLDDKARYVVRLRTVLDQNTLPGPLRLFAFWGDSFRLQSKWYSWMLSA